MAPKKKKTQIKAPPRPIATTSVPKKVEPAPEAGVESKIVAKINDKDEQPADDGNKATNQLINAQIVTPQKVEEEPLQSLVDRFQDKIEKDISRTVKTIESDRRLAKSETCFTLDEPMLERIIELCKSFWEQGKGPVDEQEEKALMKLAVTYGVLRRLGFTEDRVIECLRAIQGIELEDAYDWLHLYCTEDELDVEEVAEISEPRTPRTPHIPQTPQKSQPTRLPAQIHSKNEDLSHASVKAAVTTPASVQSSSNSSTGDPKDPRTSFNTLIHSHTSSSDSDSDSDDPTAKYVRLNKRLAKLTTHRRPGDRASHDVVQDIKRQIAQVAEDYLFDKNAAVEQWEAEKRRLDISMLQDKLRGNIQETPNLPKPPSKARPPRTEVPEPKTPASDVFSDNDSDTGGVFDILEEIPLSITDDRGITIQVRDMALPKHWSGQLPKKLLAEFVGKVDRFAAVTYSNLSGNSRASRSAVSIRWNGRKSDDWVMDDVACHDSFQSEQYISLIALHSLSYPSTAGFAGGNSTTSSAPTFFRLLSPSYRDLWDELEEKRKKSNDTINRSTWAKLQKILEPKLEVFERTSTRITRLAIDTRDASSSKNKNRFYDHINESLRDAFTARQNSPDYQAMLPQRNSLPIAQFRQEIVSTIEHNQVLVLSGETGCGKSTQLPAFILEDHLSQGKHCKIYCTEPRRISAVSLAQRVSRELGEPAGAVGTINSFVGYSIRLESNTSRNTRLAYVTNGVALRMLEGGSGPGGEGMAFDEITHIIIDEVHERSIESDFLLIVLKSLMEQRPSLRIVLMSATVDAEKISKYFGGCPVLHVPGRTFPVNIRYLEDAIEYTDWTVSESSQYARRSNDNFYKGKSKEWSEDTIAADDDDEDSAAVNVKLEKRYSEKTAKTINLFDERLIPYELIIRLLEKLCFRDPSNQPFSAAILIFMPGIAEIRRLNDMLSEHSEFGQEDNFKIHPLHSTLSSESQSAVFEIPPEGVRKIVISTNIAETGVTIPDVTCVIDTGKHREMRFDEKRQISRLIETFIARSNAAQRRGRAGRVQEGLCFHLFTKLRHDTMLADNPLPEMMRLSLSDLALRIKIMKVNLGSSIEDTLSRALDPPSSINIQRAVSSLVEVRALTSSEEITPLGRLLSQLPTDVHLGKFLLIAASFHCLDPALTIAATLNSKSPFITPLGEESRADAAKASFRIENSDFLTIHNAFESWRRVVRDKGPSFVRDFCRKNYLSHQNLQQIEELRQQFLGYLIDCSFIQVDPAFVKELSRARYHRGFKTRFVTVPSNLSHNSSNTALVNAALVAGLYPKILTIKDEQMRTSNNKQAFFHPSSVNFRKKLSDLDTHFLAYFTLMQSKKLYVWETCPVDDLAFLLLCGEVDFKLPTNLAVIDRKYRFQLSPRTNIALKVLRKQLYLLLAQQYRGSILTEAQTKWKETALMALGKVKLGESEPTTSAKIVLNR